MLIAERGRTGMKVLGVVGRRVQWAREPRA
jgi:hypothetical protein